jgi:hypothetical protein
MSRDPFAAQRATLTACVVARIADAVGDAYLPGTLYGLVLEYSLGGLSAYIWPLYELTRLSLLETGKKPHALWDPSWAEGDQLPPGVPEELRERNIDVPLYEDEQLTQAFWHYCGGPPNNDKTYDAMESLWLDVAAALTQYDWNDRVEVTDDFVAVAYPMEGTDAEICLGLEHSLGPERFRQFESRGWIPEQEAPIH